MQIDDRWVLVDATWDPPLACGGFPVNEPWDGRADTICAVKPLRSAVRKAFCLTATTEPCRDRAEPGFNPCDGEQGPRDAGDNARYNRRKTRIRTPEEIERIRRFYQEFEIWLQEVREQR